MKTTTNLTILITIILFSFSRQTFAQDEYIITLYVNTGEITKPDINQYCNFGQEDGVSNEEFLVEASIGDTIIWRGKSTSSEDDVVNITSINHRGGNNVFDKNVLRGDGNDPEEVMGVVEHLSKKGNKKDYKYTIKFTVMNNGVKRNGTFQIDPKLRVVQ